MDEEKRILIIDDDQVVLTSLRKLLELSGFEAEVCSEARGAFELIKNRKPQLILLDLRMPGLGGFEICEMLNSDKETSRIPVIIVSALGGDADVKKAYKLGVVGYVAKPYDFQVLLREVKKALEYKTDLPGGPL